MQPLTQNIIATIGSVIYAKSLVFICTKLREHQVVDVNLSRKLVHVLAGTFSLCWPFFESNHWSRVLAITLPFLYSIVLYVKGAIIRDVNDTDVVTMSRSGDPSELLAGPLYYTSVMAALGLLLFMRPSGVLILAILSWGDGLAPYFGQLYGTWKYQTFGRIKSYVGSLVMFIAAFLGGILMYIPLFGTPSLHVLYAHMIACFVATIAEALSPADLDNVIIPIVAYIVFRFMGIH